MSINIEISDFDFETIYRNQILHRGRCIDNTPKAHAEAMFEYLTDEYSSELQSEELLINQEIEQLEEQNSELQQIVYKLEKEVRQRDLEIEELQGTIEYLRYHYGVEEVIA